MKQEVKILPLDLFNCGEDWKDYYLELKQLRKGDIFYECLSRDGENYELKAMENPRKTKNGWVCKVQKTDKEIVELYVSANTTYNGPNFFRTPQHVTQLDNGKYAYIVK